MNARVFDFLGAVRDMSSREKLQNCHVVLLLGLPLPTFFLWLIAEARHSLHAAVAVTCHLFMITKTLRYICQLWPRKFAGSVASSALRFFSVDWWARLALRTLACPLQTCSCHPCASVDSNCLIYNLPRHSAVWICQRRPGCRFSSVCSQPSHVFFINHVCVCVLIITFGTFMRLRCASIHLRDELVAKGMV